MAEKFIEINTTDGCLQENEALVTSAGAADAGKIPALASDGKLDPTVLRDIVSITVNAAEALGAGDLVYIDGSGEAALASAASGGNAATGYVTDTVIAAAPVTVFFDGINADMAGLTVGSKYFLSDTVAGGVVLAASLPAATGELVQEVGTAISATELNFEQQRPVKLA